MNNIIPQPYKYVSIVGRFVIDEGTKMYSEADFSAQAARFAKLVQDASGIAVGVTEDISEAQIIFNKSDTPDCTIADASYVIKCSGGILSVISKTERCCFYAVESLRQLFRLDQDRDEVACDNCYISDRPKFRFRSLQLDLARHFVGVEDIKRIIDLMSRVKLNKLHLHLSDDQGFRVEIAKYPLLNEIGSYRNGTERCRDGVRFVDENRYGAYITKADVAEIVGYAQSKFVEIIPEIDMPGHITAALAAYPQFGCEGVSEVRSRWGVSKEALCVGNDQAIDFAKDILEEICQMFPGSYVHIGGNEVLHDRWCNCKKCQERLSDLGLDSVDGLHAYFSNELGAYLKERGKKTICWGDGVTDITDAETLSQVWSKKTCRKAVRMAKRGRKTIVSLPVLQFDRPYEEIPLKKTYKLNAQKHFGGSKSGVVGVEGLLWTEYIEGDKLYFNLLPRMLALSECAWGANGNYRSFMKRACKYSALYAKQNLPYNEKALKHGAKTDCLANAKGGERSDGEVNTFDTMENAK